MKRFYVAGFLLFAGMVSGGAEAPLSFAILGDSGVRTDVIKNVRKNVGDHGVRRLILPGDNLYKPEEESYGDVWDSWLKRDFSFDVVAIGNHNLSYRAEMRYFGMPSEYYGRSFGNARFLVLNSDNDATAGEQTEWLAGELKNLRESTAFIVYHHPTYTITDRHAWTEKRAFHEAIRPVIFRYRDKITALLIGHDHIASLLEFDGLPVIVSGAAHEQRDAPRLDYRGSDGVRVRTRWLYREHSQWARLDLDARSGKAWVNFIDAKTDQITCTARIEGGRLELNENCAESDSDAPVVREEPVVIIQQRAQRPAAARGA